jgi:hypothetical protein
MINVRAKIEKSIRQRGVRATIRLSLYNLAYYAGKLTPSALARAKRERDFDKSFGVDTAGTIDLSDLGDVFGVAAELGTRYEPIAPAIFHTVMEELRRARIDLSALTFIDYGCGKGRALLLASHYPFRSIIGIEISSKLFTIASDNIGRYQAPDRKCLDLSVVNGDALEWEPPDRPTLFYFYHPFEPELLAQVLDRLRASMVKHPRKAYVLYIGDTEDMVPDSDFLTPVFVQRDEPRHGIYECR